MKNYATKINGIDHMFQLSDEDAVKRGLDPAKDATTDAPAESTPLDFAKPSTDGQDVEANVAADLAAQEAEVKARAAANKSRAAASK